MAPDLLGILHMKHGLMGRAFGAAALVALLCLVLSSSAYAQISQSSSIAGAVKDTTGAVMPGVTVEVASPVLIEKVRTAITDGQGLYLVTDLRPGAYTVTF